MNEYVLSYCTEDRDILDNPDNRCYWRCYADNYDQAVKQLTDIVKNVNYYELIKINK